MWGRAVRHYWTSEYAAITLQRAVCGYFSRCYVTLLRKLAPIAATKIQRCYQRHRRYKAHMEWLELVRRAARIILPIMKLFIAKLAKSTYHHYEASAVCIQSLIRGFICRARLFRRYGDTVFLGRIVPYSAVLVQRIARGFLARRRVLLLWDELLYLKITAPATGLLQRVYRGHLGRLIARAKRKRKRAAVFLQVRLWLCCVGYNTCVRFEMTTSASHPLPSIIFV